MISVVVPVFDEVENVGPLVDELRAILGGNGTPYEIVLVDDGSTHGSGEAIARLAQTYPEVRGLHFRENRGQTAVFDAGPVAERTVLATVVLQDREVAQVPIDFRRLP